MSWHHERGLRVQVGHYVEMTKPGRIKHLSMGKRYIVLQKGGVFGQAENAKSPAIRVYLRCDDGKTRSFNTWNFKISDNQIHD